ncbi:Aste57867_18172 [Aphanomyces stellatus]|uniref:Aste57867_18172 protein n=1 Tax=Aphanomyces stellatus TaxID=120398 RepID=A0A485LAA0_9STRA|nr:hypothetical protein As57867_018110 [Aphanomyces stellatus]VFT94910.1 Aste57867_18172 [Aphanomyces stellatus]
MAKAATRAAIFLILVTGSVDAAPPPTCARHLSREAMLILHQKVYQPARALSYELPPSCPLASNNILYLENEAQKERLHSGRYRCGLCKKQFRTEEYMDKHFDRAHSTADDETGGDDGLCLGDYCDILNCPTHRASARHAKCTHSSLRRLKQQCTTLLQACFPYEEPSFNATTLRRGEPISNRLFDELKQSVCEAIECEAPEKVEPPSMGYLMAESFVKLMVLVGALVGLMYIFDKPVEPSRGSRARLDRRNPRTASAYHRRSIHHD